MRILSALMSLVFVCPTYSQVTVIGEGKVTATPDIANIRFSVIGESPKAVEALKQVAKVVEKVNDGLVKDFNFKQADICTDNFSLSPKFRWDKISDQNVFVGYVVVHAMHLTVRDIKTVGEVIDSLAKNGVNRVDSISFVVSKLNVLLDEARKAAVADAVRKAMIYAKEGNAVLGGPTKITESGRHAPIYTTSVEKMATTSVQVGELQFSITVSVEFALK